VVLKPLLSQSNPILGLLAAMIPALGPSLLDRLHPTLRIAMAPTTCLVFRDAQFAGNRLVRLACIGRKNSLRPVSRASLGWRRIAGAPAAPRLIDQWLSLFSSAGI